MADPVLLLRRSLKNVAVLFAAVLLHVNEPGTEGAMQRQEFSSATLVDGQLEFLSPIPIDWLELAPGDLVEFEIDRPPPQLLSELIESEDMFGNAEVRFETPLPASLQGYVFYFISESGINEVHAGGLRGTVRFGLSKGSIISRRVFGHVAATAVGGSRSDPAGFILSSTRRRVFEIGESTLDPAYLVPADVRDKWNELPAQARQFWTIRRQYSFWSDHDLARRTFVQWAPDTQCYEACCEIRYSVFVSVESPRLVAGYSGQCDI